jgi:hypothetical protein
MRLSLYGAKDGGEGDEEGISMRRSSRHVILERQVGGDRLVLGNADEVWLYTRTLSECKCGHDVSLANRVEGTERTCDMRDNKIAHPRNDMS